MHRGLCFPRALLGLALALCARGAAWGQAITRRIGPIRLEGVQLPMRGPYGIDEFKFPAAGWVKGYTVHVFDARDQPADAAGLLCHAAFIGDQRMDGDPLPGLGIHTVATRLSTAEGQNSVRFPDGFGLEVDTETVFQIVGVLQSSGHAHDGSYWLTADFDFVPRDNGPGLAPLDVWRVDIGTTPGVSHQWDLPPGRHAFSSSFGVPQDVVVHMIDFHLHRFVESVELIEVSDPERVLYREAVKNRGDGYLVSAPRYADAQGIALRRNARYAFRVAFDNPLRVSERTMALMRLYVERVTGPPPEASSKGPAPASAVR